MDSPYSSINCNSEMIRLSDLLKEETAKTSVMQKQIAELEKQLADNDHLTVAYKKGLEDGKAERDRLREALVEIADWDMLAHSKKGLIAIIGVLVDKAKDALKGAGNE